MAFFCGTVQVNRYQKEKTNLDFTKALGDFTGKTLVLNQTSV